VSPDALQLDTVPCVITSEKLRRRPSPNRAAALLSWGGEAERPARATDESDGGIGMNLALGVAPAVGAVVTLRFADGETRQAVVRHIMPERGCVHLGLAWVERE
jgi:hypothetical protein